MYGKQYFVFFLTRVDVEMIQYFYLFKFFRSIFLIKTSSFMADYQETNLWEWCKTHGDYEGYLMRYPNGSFAAEARLFMSGNNSATKSNNVSY